MKYLQTYLATNSEMIHVTRVAGGGVTRLVTRVSSRAAAHGWVRADSGQTIICYLLTSQPRGGHHRTQTCIT